MLLGTSEARLAAMCSAKGRMIASFIGIRPDDERVLLVCSRDILPATQKRLSMFVLRAKVKLSDASADFVLHGLAGTALAENGLDAAAVPGQRSIVGEASAVSLYPADGVPRAGRTVRELPAIWPRASRPSLPTARIAVQTAPTDRGSS